MLSEEFRMRFQLIHDFIAHLVVLAQVKASAGPDVKSVFSIGSHLGGLAVLVNVIVLRCIHGQIRRGCVPIVLKGPTARIIGNAQPFHSVQELIHMFLPNLQIAVILGKENIAEQVLHFGRILFAELHDGVPGMHTAVVDQDRKVLCGSIEAGSKIGMIVSEPLPLEGL